MFSFFMMGSQIKSDEKWEISFSFAKQGVSLIVWDFVSYKASTGLNPVEHDLFFSREQR